MIRTNALLALFLLPALKPSQIPAHTSDARLKLPADYRDWVFLTSGFDMSYDRSATPAPQSHSMFDNDFVNPASYRAFQQTGHWPEGTTLVLEARMAAADISINKHGRTQSDVMGLEVHVKDSAHNPGDGWAFYSFDDGPAPATRIPSSAGCYSCHQEHAAVDTAFVQFYPTLLPIAQAKHTLSPAYLAETPTQK